MDQGMIFGYVLELMVQVRAWVRLSGSLSFFHNMTFRDLQCTLGTIMHYTLYTVYCIQYSIYCIVYTVYSIQYIVYTIQYTVYGIHLQCILY